MGTPGSPAHPVPAALPAGPPPLTPNRHTLSSLRAMAREPGARARRRPKLRRERPGPARASPGAAAARPSPGRGARRDSGCPFAGPRPGPSAASRAGAPSAAGTGLRPRGRRRRRHLGTLAGHLTSPPTSAATFAARAGPGWRREALGDARGAGPLAEAPPPARRPRLQAHPKMAGEWGWAPRLPLPRPGPPLEAGGLPPAPEPARGGPLVTPCMSLGFQRSPCTLWTCRMT